MHSLQIPPDLLEPDVNARSLRIIEWQLTQDSLLLETYEKERERSHAQKEQLADEADAVSNIVPLEFRFLNAEARSAYVARLISLTLDLRLEMATHEVMLDKMTKAEDEGVAADKQLEELRHKQLNLEIATSQLQVDTAARELELSKELLQRHGNSEAEMNIVRKSNELAIAKHRHSYAKMQLELAKESTNAQRAKALSDHRLAIAPLSARLELASQALEDYRKSASVFDRIESLRREQQALLSQSDRVADEIGRIKRENVELNMLKHLITEHGNASEDSGGKSTATNNKE